MRYLLLLALFTTISSSFAYEVTYETEVSADELDEIEDQRERAAHEAANLDRAIYGIFKSARYEITEQRKINIVLKFEERKIKSPFVGNGMPGVQFAPLFSGTFYDSSLGYTPKMLNTKKSQGTPQNNISGSGRLQVFFDMGRALRLKMRSRILITAGYYTNFISLTENNNQRKMTLLPTRQFGEINLGLRLKLGAPPRKPLVNNFAE